MSNSTKTVSHVLKVGADFLESKKVKNSRLVCEILLSRLLSCQRLELYLRYKDELSEKQLAAMRRGIKRVGVGEPVQYITGEAGFMDYVFKVDRRALIPRPETEVLVKSVLECNALWQHEEPHIVDVGTGSGCIVLSLASVHKNAKYLAIDISDEALSLARENAERMKLSEHVNFVNVDISDVIEPESVNAVVANLPYISTSDCENLDVEVRDYEPRTALDGGVDGLCIIEAVVQDAGIVLQNGGMIFLEIGDDQGPKVKSLLEAAGFSDVKVIHDLTERDRVVLGQLSI